MDAGESAEDVIRNFVLGIPIAGVATDYGYARRLLAHTAGP